MSKFHLIFNSPKRLYININTYTDTCSRWKGPTIVKYVKKIVNERSRKAIFGSKSMKNILTFRNVIAKLDNIWNFTETLKEGKLSWRLKNVFNPWNKLECTPVKFLSKSFHLSVLNGRRCYVIFKYLYVIP